MSEADLSRKLQIKPGMALRLMNVPADIAARLSPMPEGALAANSGRGPFDGVLAFFTTRKEIAVGLPQALTFCGPDGLLWFAYPKISSGVPTDVTRDKGWDPALKAGLRPVRAIAVDETWTALRFRPEGSTLRKMR